MRFQTYLLPSCLALLAGMTSSTLVGCGSNESLGSGLPDDAGLGGASGATSVTAITGGNAPLGGTTTSPGGASAQSSAAGGASGAGTTALAGQSSVLGSSSASGGSTVRAGSTATGGALAGTTSVAGQTAVGGSASGGVRTGGNTVAGGNTTVASGGSSGDSGVILTASMLDTGYIQATWQNNTQASIFLYGCGTVSVYRKDSTGWTNLGQPVVCGWEGVSPEVKPGATLNDAAYGPVGKNWPGTGGTFRLSGKYGVGCTNPGAGQSKAGCTAFYEATSNEIVVTLPSPDAGVDVACGPMPEGVTCRKPTGGCAAMSCNNGSWACAAGQTPVGLVPGACDVGDAGNGG